MAENSAIEWTDCTFNPWMGCTKVSGACKHCYAETLMDTRYGKVKWGPKGLRQRTSASNWRKPHQWNERQRQWREAAEAAGVPYQRPRVFCASLADVFEGADTMSAESAPVVEQARRDLWALIEATPELDWLLLTKRPENVLRMVPRRWLSKFIEFGDLSSRDRLAVRWPSNVWLGTTVEDQQSADERIPHLLQAPAAVRFLSAEPLLGPVDLAYACFSGADSFGRMEGISWVIVGAESLSKRAGRPTEIEWVRSLRDQCAEAGVPFLLKQLVEDGRIVGAPQLDGRQWLEVPRT